MVGRTGVGHEEVTSRVRGRRLPPLLLGVNLLLGLSVMGCAGSPQPTVPVMTEPFGAPGPREEYHIRLDEVDEQFVAQGDYAAAAFRLRVIRNDLDNDTRSPGELWRDDFRARAMFWSAWCLQRCDRPVEASADYTELIRTYPASRWARRAMQFLRMLPPVPPTAD